MSLISESNIFCSGLVFNEIGQILCTNVYSILNVHK